MLKEGDRAPDFSVTADDGSKVSLADYRGKNLILYFYPKANTTGCTHEAVEFRDAIEGIQVVEHGGGGLQRRFRREPDEIQDEVQVEFSAARRYGIRSDRGLRRAPHEEFLREILSGNRAHDILDRPGREDSQDLARVTPKGTPPKYSPLLSGSLSKQTSALINVTRNESPSCSIKRVIDQARAADAGRQQDVARAPKAHHRFECVRVHDFRVVERHARFGIDDAPQAGHQMSRIAFAGSDFAPHIFERAVKRCGRAAIILLQVRIAGRHRQAVGLADDRTGDDLERRGSNRPPSGG